MPPAVAPENDNQKEILQMIGFIKAEAGEKILEIRQKAQSEYQVQYQELKREAEYVLFMGISYKYCISHTISSFVSMHPLPSIIMGTNKGIYEHYRLISCYIYPILYTPLLL